MFPNEILYLRAKVKKILIMSSTYLINELGTKYEQIARST